MEHTEINAPEALTSDEQLSASQATITQPEALVNTSVQEVDPLSSKFAALARKERLNKQKERELAEKESRFSELDSWNSSFETEIKSDPLKVLARYGYSFQDLAERALKTGDVPNPGFEKLTEAEKRIAQLEARLESDAQASIEEKRQGALGQISQFVSSQSDKYEFIQAEDAADVVLQVLQQHYNAYGVPLSLEEAADMTEKFFEEKASRYTNIKKLQSKFQPPPQAPIAATPKPEKTNGRPTTINSTVLSAPAQREERRLSDTERAQLTLQVLRGGKQKVD